MTISTFAASGTQTTLAPVDYQPGVCNIGPAEIARRRRAGHVGLVAALALFAVLVAIDAPNWTRLLIAIPAVMAASGYIQARLKFCAGFGSRGVFNFGEVGPMERVADDADRARDRAQGAPDRRGKHRHRARGRLDRGPPADPTSRPTGPRVLS